MNVLYRELILISNIELRLIVLRKTLPHTGMIVRPCNTAIIALAFAFYVLRPFFPDCDPPGDATRMLAIVCICKFTTTNHIIYL